MDLSNQTHAINNILGQLVEKTKSQVDRNSKKFKTRKYSVPFVESESLESKILKSIYKFKKSELQINQIPKAILGFPFFERYHSCNLLVHEKGAEFATSFNSKKSNSHYICSQTKMSIQSFNDLFKLIKKSKNRKFDQTNLKIKDLQLNGIFLARNISFQNHSVILITTRNDFIPIETLEQETFDNTSTILDNFIQFHLYLDYYQNKSDRIKHVIDCLPCKIDLKENDGCLLYSNLPMEKNQQLFQSLHLTKKSWLDIYIEKIQENHTNMFHLQKISLFSELLNTLRHELNNPIFGIKLSVDILMDETLNLELKETLSDISKNIETCQQLMFNITHFYSAEELITFADIREVIERATTLCKSELRDVYRKVSFHKFQNEDSYQICTNSHLLIQILFNLIVNAAQAIRSANVDKKAIHLDVYSQDPFIQIVITDFGPGIKEEHEKMLFKPFFTTKENGNGLGLSICQNLAHKLGGALSFKNRTNEQPTTFTLTIPKKNNLDENITH